MWTSNKGSIWYILMSKSRSHVRRGPCRCPSLSFCRRCLSIGDRVGFVLQSGSAGCRCRSFCGAFQVIIVVNFPHAVSFGVYEVSSIVVSSQGIGNRKRHVGFSFCRVPRTIWSCRFGVFGQCISCMCWLPLVVVWFAYRPPKRFIALTNAAFLKYCHQFMFGKAGWFNFPYPMPIHCLEPTYAIWRYRLWCLKASYG